MRILFPLCAAILLQALPAATGDGPVTAETVLARFVQVVGGRAALEARTLVHHRGTIVQDLTWKEPTHQEWSFRAEADTAGAVRYAETVGWADLPDTHCADLSSKLRWIMHPRFALVVAEFFPDLRYAGTELREGRFVQRLVPARLPPEHHALSFDEETGLLAHVGYHTDVLDWRAVDGVLVPHRWVCGRKGGHTTWVFAEIATGPAPTGD
jgi:hypothetical protein